MDNRYFSLGKEGYPLHCSVYFDAKRTIKIGITNKIESYVIISLVANRVSYITMYVTLDSNVNICRSYGRVRY